MSKMDKKIKTQLPKYSEFEQTLLSLKTELSPAECQGIALGLLAWDKDSKALEVWEDLLVEEFGPDFHQNQDKQNFDVLFTLARTGLKNDSYALSLYMPSDKEPLPFRLEAISVWCKGFMFGLGLIGFDNRMLSNPLVHEALQDISQIMNIELHLEEESEDNEKSYFELMEYLRMATIVIYTQITGRDEVKTHNQHGLH